MRTLLITVLIICTLKFLIRFILLWRNHYPRNIKFDHTDDMIAMLEALVLAAWTAFVLWT